MNNGDAWPEDYTQGEDLEAMASEKPHRSPRTPDDSQGLLSLLVQRVFDLPTRQEMKQEIKDATEGLATQQDVKLASMKIQLWILGGVIVGILILVRLFWPGG